MIALSNMTPNLILFIFTMISLLFTVGIYLLIRFTIKSERKKEFILKSVTVLTIVIHYSNLWVDYLLTGQAFVDDTMLFAIYPCHILMWMTFISAFIKDKSNKYFRPLLEFSAYGGVICGFIGLAFNVNFLATPDLKNYDIFKGLISHVTLILSGVLLFDCCKVKVNTKTNMIATIFGLLVFAIQGLFINVLFDIFNLPEVNAMYMLYSPFEKIPFINFFTIGIAALLVMFIFTTIFETIFYKKENRWYSSITKKNRK